MSQMGEKCPCFWGQEMLSVGDKLGLCLLPMCNTKAACKVPVNEAAIIWKVIKIEIKSFLNFF